MNKLAGETESSGAAGHSIQSSAVASEPPSGNLLHVKPMGLARLEIFANEVSAAQTKCRRSVVIDPTRLLASQCFRPEKDLLATSESDLSDWAERDRGEFLFVSGPIAVALVGVAIHLAARQRPRPCRIYIDSLDEVGKIPHLTNHMVHGDIDVVATVASLDRLYEVYGRGHGGLIVAQFNKKAPVLTDT